MEKLLLENIYDIITENAENIKVENGVNQNKRYNKSLINNDTKYNPISNKYYTQNNKIFIETNDDVRLFEITIKEVEEVE